MHFVTRRAERAQRQLWEEVSLYLGNTKAKVNVTRTNTKVRLGDTLPLIIHAVFRRFWLPGVGISIASQHEAEVQS